MIKNIKQLFSKLFLILVIFFLNNIYAQQYDEIDDSQSEKTSNNKGGNCCDGFFYRLFDFGSLRIQSIPPTIYPGIIYFTSNNGDLSEFDASFENEEYRSFVINNNGNLNTVNANGNVVINTTFVEGYLNNQHHANIARQLLEKKKWEDWERRQRNIIKDYLDYEHGLFATYNNYDEAIGGFFKFHEKRIVLTGGGIEQKVKDKEVIRERCLRNIKLLDYRANEIHLGNINNPKYGHFKLYGNGDTPLDKIKTINKINELRAQEISMFSDNQWRLDQEKRILNQIQTKSYRNDEYFNYHVNLWMDKYRSFGDEVDRYYFLSYMIHGKGEDSWTSLISENTPGRLERSSSVTYVDGEFTMQDIGYLWRNTQPNLSVFHPDYWFKYRSASPFHNNFVWAKAKAEGERQEALNNALNDFDLGKVLVEAAIAGLGAINEDYINDRPTLKAEIENYFSLNDHSKLSHDCANYLLNQYLGGGQFKLGENYYASAGVPEFNSPFNPNIAIGTNLNAIAKRDEFTYLNNVLAALLNDSVHRPEYKGQIIREVFEANGINIPVGLGNATLANYFNFAPTAADSMRIDHARGHGVKTNLDQYLNELKDFHNTVQDLLKNDPTLAYVDYENRIVEVLNFTNDADALEIANMFSSEIAKNNYLKLQHHLAIVDSAQDMLQAGFNEGLEFSKMANRDPEGLRIVTHEVAEISAIDDIAEDIGENGSSFWPQNPEEWQAFGEMMLPLLGEILIGFTPVGDYYDLLNSIDSGDVLGASLAIGGIIISSTSLGPIKGAIKGARAFRKALKIYRKLRPILGALRTAIQKGFKVVLDSLGRLILKRGDDVLETSDDLVKEALQKISTPGAIKFWTNQTTFRNVKVYKRDDIINGGLVDNIGRTNKQRMQAGIAPIGPDGKSVNLHHMLQSDAAGIAEMTETFHKTNHRTIHINPNTIPSGIDRSAFATWKRNYWKNRANDF